MYKEKMECLTMAKDGLHGFFHRPKEQVDDEKAVIVIGGSEGTEQIPREVGAAFADAGFAALGLNYWNVPGCPKEIVNIPVEVVERAVNWLEGRGYTRIALYGFSKGAELALLAASLIPKIRCVIALAPSFCVWAGVTGGANPLRKGMDPEKSSFTWRGAPLPYVRGKRDFPEVLRRALREGEPNLRFMYERALAEDGEEEIAKAVIQVEKINGPLLLISPDRDRIWPSEMGGQRILARLEERGFSHSVEHIVYPKCSHFIAPVKMPFLRAFRVERQEAEACGRSREDAFSQCIKWLKAW